MARNMLAARDPPWNPLGRLLRSIRPLAELGGKEKGGEGDGCALPAPAPGSANLMSMMIIIIEFLRHHRL